MKTVSSVDGLVAHVRDLAASDQRTLILIDGYPKSGKTTIAQRLAAIPRVEWTPADLFMNGDDLDLKKVRKDLIKPFRKDGKVREVVPSLGGGRLQRGRPQSDIKVLIIEGMGICTSAKRLRPNELWWIDSTAEERADRSGASEGIPGATMTGVIEMMRTVEETGLREDALKTAAVLVDVSNSGTELAVPEELSEMQQAAAAENAGFLDDDLDRRGDADDDELDRMLTTTSSIFARSDNTDDSDNSDDSDEVDDESSDADSPPPLLTIAYSDELDLPTPPSTNGPGPGDFPRVPGAPKFDADDGDSSYVEFTDPLRKHHPGNGSGPAAFDVVDANGAHDGPEAEDGPVELIPFNPGFTLPSESGELDYLDDLDSDLDADLANDLDDVDGLGDSDDLIPGWLGDD